MGPGIQFLLAVAVIFFLGQRWPWLRALYRFCADGGKSPALVLLALVPWAGPKAFYVLIRPDRRYNLATENAPKIASPVVSNFDKEHPAAALVLDLRKVLQQPEAVMSDDFGRQLVAVHDAKAGGLHIALAETADHFSLHALHPGDIVLWQSLADTQLAKVPLVNSGTQPTIGGEVVRKLNGRQPPRFRNRKTLTIGNIHRGYASRGGKGGGFY